MMSRAAQKKKEFGDFQTSPGLAEATTRVLARLGLQPSAVIEPTCGQGAFVKAAAEAFPAASYIFGNDLNPAYIATAGQQTRGDDRVKLQCGDFFGTDWRNIIDQNMGPWLVIGNPPWVTNAELGALGSSNHPAKTNLHNHTGIEAITGKSNFDISEWMLLQYIEWLVARGGFIAVLCKTAVARKVLLTAWKKRAPIRNAWMFHFDAQVHFGAAAAACLFVLELQPGAVNQSCKVFDSFDVAVPSRTLGYHAGHLVSDADSFYRWQMLLGPEKTHVWRSGIKHDCSKILELTPDANGYRNGLGEIIALEDRYLFPLMKGSDVGNARSRHRKLLLTIQRSVGDDTASIRTDAPLTWRYLQQHASHFEKRASSIYRNKPQFSIFGVGPYSYSPWKVAICGLYKRLCFVCVGPVADKPVLFDDTVYFLPAASQQQAEFMVQLLASKPAAEFLGSMVSWDDKRPITADLLRRLNIRQLARVLGREPEYLRLAGFQPAPTQRQQEMSLWVQAGGI